VETALCYHKTGPIYRAAWRAARRRFEQKELESLASTKSPSLRFITILILLLSLCIAPGAQASLQDSAASVAASPERSLSESLSYKDRLDIFEEVWETVEEKYYDSSFNGVNWRDVGNRYRPMLESISTDDEFYALLKRMVGELKDAHTRFHTPRERREREQLQAVSAGVSMSEVEGRVVILGVEPASEAEQSGIKSGMIVRTIDGKPVAEQISLAQSRIGGTSSSRAERLRLFRKLIEGEPGTLLKLGLEKADGAYLDVSLARRTVSDAPRVTTRVLDSGIGYLRLNIWKSPVHKQFKAALEQLKDVPALIIDLRGNPGGEAAEVVKIAGYFFNTRTSFGRFISRSGRTIELNTDSDDQIYKGPVAVLVNEASGSGSELFSGVMQETGRATIVGRQSCGCVLGISKFRKVKGGGELAVSELGYISPRGRRLEGEGVSPNRAVALTIADLQRERDAVIIEAESALRMPKATMNN
jgi:carboxyl-terminal processing protease